MVNINRVYTGGGDGGESSLVDGSRRKKSDVRFDVVGVCDEVNSWLGMVLAELHRLPDHEDGGERTNVQRVQTVLNEALVRVQNELFDLGAELACPPATLPEYMVLLSQEQTDVLMAEMDAWLASLPPLTSFILPAGSPPVANMQVTGPSFAGWSVPSFDSSTMRVRTRFDRSFWSTSIACRTGSLSWDAGSA